MDQPMPKALHLMDRAINWVLAALMAAMVVVIAMQVWYRFILNNPLDWSEELGRYLFVWISFLGSAAGVRYQVHLGIDVLEKIVGRNAFRYVVVLINLVIQVFLLFVIFWGIKLLGVVQFQTSPSMLIPMTYPYAAVPVGAVFMLINSLRVAHAALKGKPLDLEIAL
jgi:TRAP-type C4-dicarboxylate transport system permease small subunit